MYSTNKQIKKLIIINTILITTLAVLPQHKQNIQEVAQIQIEIQEDPQAEIVPEQEIIQEDPQAEEPQQIIFTYDMNLLTPSNITAEQLEQGFTGTKMAGLGQHFIQAEQETGINALYLAGLACHESGWNTSNFAKTRNNLFGWQSYDSNLNATKRFNTKGTCISFVASKLKKLYLTENGMFHSGYTIESISKRYASDKQHSQKVYKTIQKLISKMA